jgi:hypothetical protein
VVENSCVCVKEKKWLSSDESNSRSETRAKKRSQKRPNRVQIASKVLPKTRPKRVQKACCFHGSPLIKKQMRKQRGDGSAVNIRSVICSREERCRDRRCQLGWHKTKSGLDPGRSRVMKSSKSATKSFGNGVRQY